MSAAAGASLVLVLVFGGIANAVRDESGPSFSGEQASAPNVVERADYDSTVRVTKVVDGDTVEISPSVEGLATVRLIGVDTPETHGGTQPYGPEASDFTRRNLEGKEVSLELDVEKVDPYGRLLAYVYPPGREMFNETLVEQGAAAQIAIWTAPTSKPTNRLSAFLSKTRAIRPTSTATVTVWRARNYYPKV